MNACCKFSLCSMLSILLLNSICLFSLYEVLKCDIYYVHLLICSGIHQRKIVVTNMVDFMSTFYTNCIRMYIHIYGPVVHWL